MEGSEFLILNRFAPREEVYKLFGPFGRYIKQ